MAFNSGHDFTGELIAYGFPAGPAGDAPIREAMPAAWQEFGAIYLGRFHDPASGEPYALEVFGAPPC